MNTVLAKSKAIQALQAAIDAYTGNTGPGRWQVVPDMDERLPAIGLSYIVDATLILDESTFSHDHPWKIFGGDKIIDLAGIGCYFDGIGESYIDKYGDEVYSDTAYIEVTDEEE